MQNNFIPLSEWNHSNLVNLECLYGYSYKSQGYFPFKTISEIKWVGKTGRIGVKGFAENNDKTYIQINTKQIDKVIENGWIQKPEINENNI